jgi:hypothetical protein
VGLAGEGHRVDLLPRKAEFLQIHFDLFGAVAAGIPGIDQDNSISPEQIGVKGDPMGHGPEIFKERNVVGIEVDRQPTDTGSQGSGIIHKISSLTFRNADL